MRNILLSETGYVCGLFKFGWYCGGAFYGCLCGGPDQRAVTRKLRFSHALKIAFCFGLFQAVMPLIGSFIGKVGAGFISQVDHWIAFVLLGYIGGKMIYEAVKEQKHEKASNLGIPSA